MRPFLFLVHVSSMGGMKRAAKRNSRESVVTDRKKNEKTSLKSNLRITGGLSQKYIVALIAARSHLFPSRTEKLSSLTPMVLPHQVGE